MKKILIIIFVLLLFGCDSTPTGKSYLVATDATLVPMSFMSVGNTITGFEPDLMRAIAKEAGLNVQLVNVEWAGLFGGLITRKFDMVISSVTILEERKERMAFSEPYLKSGLALVIRKDQEGIKSFADAKKIIFYLERRLEPQLTSLWKKIPVFVKRAIKCMATRWPISLTEKLMQYLEKAPERFSIKTRINHYLKKLKWSAKS